MARGVLTPIQDTRDGVAMAAATTGDATNGHQVVNDGQIRIVAKNTNGASTSRTITFVIPNVVDGEQTPPRVETLAPGAIEEFGPFPVTVYGSPLLINVSNAEVLLSAYHD